MLLGIISTHTVMRGEEIESHPHETTAKDPFHLDQEAEVLQAHFLLMEEVGEGVHMFLAIDLQCEGVTIT
jgi:hypothetical protein